MYDFETRQQFIGYRALGKSIRSIAAMLDIHRNTAQNWDHEYKNEIDAERRCVIGLALAASGAGRIDRAKRSAEILNRLTKKLLEDAASSAQIDNQTLASYIKLCQLLDKADPPPVPGTVESRCNLPDSFDLLSTVQMPHRPAVTEQPEPVYDLFAQARSRNAVKAECTNPIPQEIEGINSGESDDRNSEAPREENIKDNETNFAEEMGLKSIQETCERDAEEPVDKQFSPMGQVWEIQEKFMAQK